MKKFFLILMCLPLGIAVSGQIWKADVLRTNGKPVVKTLKIKPETEFQAATLLKNADSIQASRYYSGIFQSFTNDSLVLKIKSIDDRLYDARGLRQSSITQAMYHTGGKADSVYRISLALKDIHFIRYQTHSQKLFSSAEDAILFGSLAMLFVSPFICYNYKEGTFNAERYKYWALGSTAGIMVGFSFQILGGVRQLQFKPDWPKKGAKVWSFK
jgi:hypothetical protein